MPPKLSENELLARVARRRQAQGRGGGGGQPRKQQSAKQRRVLGPGELHIGSAVTPRPASVPPPPSPEPAPPPPPAARESAASALVLSPSLSPRQSRSATQPPPYSPLRAVQSPPRRARPRVVPDPEGFGIGVDFGSVSVRAFQMGGGDTVAREVSGARSIPALVGLTDHLLHGKNARKELETRHSNCARHLVSWLNADAVRLEHPRSPPHVLTPELCCALVLAPVAKKCAALRDTAPWVIAAHSTLPVRNRRRLLCAAAAAGAPRVSLVPSALAIAAHFAATALLARPPPPGGVLAIVLEHGAKDSSAALVRFRAPEEDEASSPPRPAVAIEVLGLQGEAFGGWDLDRVIAERSGLTGKVPLSALMAAVEAAKRELSGVRQSAVRVRTGDTYQLTKQLVADLTREHVLPRLRAILAAACGDHWESLRTATGTDRPLLLLAGGASRVLDHLPAGALWCEEEAAARETTGDGAAPPADPGTGPVREVMDPDYSCAMGCAALSYGAAFIARDESGVLPEACGARWWAVDLSKLNNASGKALPDVSALTPVPLFAAPGGFPCAGGRDLLIFRQHPQRGAGPAPPSPRTLQAAMDAAAVPRSAAPPEDGGVRPAEDGTCPDHGRSEPEWEFCGRLTTGALPQWLEVGADNMIAPADGVRISEPNGAVAPAEEVRAHLAAELAALAKVDSLQEARNSLEEVVLRVEDAELDPAALAAVLPDAEAVLQLARDWSEDTAVAPPYQPGDARALAAMVSAALDAQEAGDGEPPAAVRDCARQLACFLPGAGAGGAGAGAGSELSDLRAAFAAYDVDGDGVLRIDELAGVLRRIGLDPSSEQLHAALRRADRDGSGAIEFPEFLGVVSSRVAVGYHTLCIAARRHAGAPPLDAAGLSALVREAAREAFDAKAPFIAEFAYHVRAVRPEPEELRRVFRLFDSDGDGYITADELRELLRRTGSDASEASVEELLRVADTDSSGTIELHEFERALDGPAGVAAFRRVLNLSRAADALGVSEARNPTAEDLQSRRARVRARRRAAELAQSFPAWYRICGPTLEALVAEAALESRSDPAVSSFVGQNWAVLAARAAAVRPR